MATNTENIGTKGRLRITVTQVSQDVVACTSKVQVKADVWLTSGSFTDNTGNCKTSLIGTNEIAPAVVKGKFTDDAKVLFNQTFVVPHEASGEKIANYTVSFGPTNSALMGKVSSTSSTALKLTTIPVRPGMPTNVTMVMTFPLGLTLFWDAPWSSQPILEYQIQYSNSIEMTNEGYVSAGTQQRGYIPGVVPGKPYYARVRARNSVGWSEWSSMASVTTPDVPAKMNNPTTVFSAPSTVTVNFSTPSSNGGSPVTNYDVQYSTFSDFSQVTTRNVAGSPLVLNGLAPDGYFFRVRANNLVGSGPWSGARAESIISGPKIQIDSGGPYYPTVVYVLDTVSWKPAIPYVKGDDQVWRMAGG